MRIRPVSAVLALLAAQGIVAFPGEGAEPAAPEQDAEALRAKPLCIVDITPVEGLPSKGLFLVSFADGVYAVCTDVGGGSRSAVSIGEADIRSVTFHPLRETRPGRWARPLSGRQAGDREAERLDRPGFFREAMRRQAEKRWKLQELRRSGKLDAYVAKRKAALASASTVEEAVRILIEIAQASRVKGASLGRQEWGRLVRSIRDPAVREKVTERQKRLIQFLGQPRPGRGPAPPAARPDGKPRDRRFRPGRGNR